MIDYASILIAKFPNTEWILDGEDYDGLIWLDNSPKPSKIILDNLWNEVLEEKENEQIAKIQAKNALLERLGITTDEAKLLFS